MVYEVVFSVLTPLASGCGADEVQKWSANWPTIQGGEKPVPTSQQSTSTTSASRSSWTPRCVWSDHSSKRPSNQPHRRPALGACLGATFTSFICRYVYLLITYIRKTVDGSATKSFPGTDSSPDMLSSPVTSAIGVNRPTVLRIWPHGAATAMTLPANNLRKIHSDRTS